MRTSTRRTVVLVMAVTLLAVGAGSRHHAEIGHAAGIPVASARVSTFRPSGLPPVCSAPSSTVIASADTWVNEQQPTNNYGTRATLSVTSRSTRDARALLMFALPATPTGCSLASATLRVYNSLPTSGRQIAAWRVDGSWTELGVTWGSQPTVAAPAVNASGLTPATAAWMQWEVTTQVQSMYSGSNHGFVLRDTAEDGAGFTQQFDSKDTTNKPELVITWG